MRKLVLILLVIASGSALSRLSIAEELRLLPGEHLPTLKNVRVEVAVTLEASGTYKYRYKISNPRSNTGRIWLVEIDIKKQASGQDLSGEGLTNETGFAKHGSAFVLSNIGTSLIPVGLFSPSNWNSGLSMNGTATWGSSDKNFRISPGQSLTGFEITSRGLPGIRSITLKPKFEQTPVDEATDENLERIIAIENAIPAVQTTVGPTAPPQNFVALEFCNYLIDLRNQAQKQNWIRQPGLIPILDAKLNAAKSSIMANENAKAITQMTDFINEVENQKVTGLTGESYALLKFNALYLRNQLSNTK